MSEPDPRLTSALEHESPGTALDLACGRGRHTIWLLERGWEVIAVDREPGLDVRTPHAERLQVVKADLEKHEFPIGDAGWDLIVCWLYWDERLIAEVARGVRPGGVVACAGKADGRFGTSLKQYRHLFEGWEEICAGSDDWTVWFIARRPLS